jgi:hypothetical protein
MKSMRKVGTQERGLADTLLGYRKCNEETTRGWTKKCVFIGEFEGFGHVGGNGECSREGTEFLTAKNTRIAKKIVGMQISKPAGLPSQLCKSGRLNAVKNFSIAALSRCGFY